jgi:2-polyprenyl-6-methoxyphenol hydroxylase-like FAD-dependent oxidoreductase
MDADVIVVGAGPTGLTLAAELGLAGVRTLLLDAVTERSRQSRAGSIQPRTAEVFAARGLLDPMLGGRPPRGTVGGHFAGLPVPLTADGWRTRYPHPVTIPQYELETFLERHLTRFASVTLRKGHGLVALRQDGDAVTGTLDDGHTVRGRWLVGCDGGHSTVRRLTGVDFPGRPGRYGMVASDVTLTGPGVTGLPTTLRHFSQAVRGRGDAQALLSPLGDGVFRFLFGGPDQLGVARDTPVTTDEVSRALRHACGDDVALGEIRYASRFSDASRQAAAYRTGRVLLAGDAAHIHLPAGGQGINLGVQDAANLGWKLAGRVRGRTDLLDTYHAERHPVAARVLANTRAQGVLMGPGDPDVGALRDLLTDLFRLPAAAHAMAGMISGLDVTYELPGPPHPLLGARMPDLDLDTADGPVRLGAFQRDGRGVLLDLTGGRSATARPWSGRVRYVAATVADPEADAVLVRPDGHVCWVAPADGAGRGLTEALTYWFGAGDAS